MENVLKLIERKNEIEEELKELLARPDAGDFYEDIVDLQEELNEINIELATGV